MGRVGSEVTARPLRPLGSGRRDVPPPARLAWPRTRPGDQAGVLVWSTGWEPVPLTVSSQVAPSPSLVLSSTAQRKKALTAVATVVVLGGLGWGAYEWLVASHYESTDNAYVQANVVRQRRFVVRKALKQFVMRVTKRIKRGSRIRNYRSHDWRLTEFEKAAY